MGFGFSETCETWNVSWDVAQPTPIKVSSSIWNVFGLWQVQLLYLPHTDFEPPWLSSFKTWWIQVTLVSQQCFQQNKTSEWKVIFNPPTTSGEWLLRGEDWRLVRFRRLGLIHFYSSFVTSSSFFVLGGFGGGPKLQPLTCLTRAASLIITSQPCQDSKFHNICVKREGLGYPLANTWSV